MPLLECVGLDVAYGRTQILFDVSIDVDEGEVLAVLGTNGAGKSTLLRAITGLTPPKGGTVLLDGRDVTGKSPVKMAALGVAQMPGGRGIFPDLSVGENLRMATWTFRRDKARCRRVIDRALDLFPALSSRLGDRAGLLSGGQQQMLALAPVADGDKTFRTFDLASLVHAGKTRATLTARGLDKRFGGVTAVDGVDLDIEPGEIVGLMGPNGAGKTTVLDVLSGFVTPDGGTMHLGELDLAPLSPDERALRGLGRSFQDARLFPGLTVTETLAVSCERWVTSREPLAAALRLPASLLPDAEVHERVERILALLRLAVFRDRFASELSTGSRRLVEFGCLLAQEPEVLLLDEPSAGLARAEAA